MPMRPHAHAHFPNCVQRDFVPQEKERALADVRKYAARPDSIRTVRFETATEPGLFVAEERHHLGELVTRLVPNGQAAMAGVRPGWIVTAVNGRRFAPYERMDDMVHDVEGAWRVGTLRPWAELTFDVRAYTDCHMGNCHMSDRFPCTESAVCAAACAHASHCQQWYLEPGRDGQEGVCTLAAGVRGMRSSPGAEMGGRGCAPTYWPICIETNEAFMFLPQRHDFITDLLRGMQASEGEEGDQRRPASAPEECAHRCASHHCLAWTFFPEINGGGRCELHRFPLIRRHVEGALSGVHSCVPGGLWRGFTPGQLFVIAGVAVLAWATSAQWLRLVPGKHLAAWGCDKLRGATEVSPGALGQLFSVMSDRPKKGGQKSVLEMDSFITASPVRHQGLYGSVK